MGKLLEFKPAEDNRAELDKKTDIDFDSRIKRITDSVNRINKLMEELRGLGDD